MSDPIPMILHCPRCGAQHVDAPEPEKGWTNPPHRSHLCRCGMIWRPADVPTVGVARIATRGSADTWTAEPGYCICHGLQDCPSFGDPINVLQDEAIRRSGGGLRKALEEIAADEKYDGILGEPPCGHPDIAIKALAAQPQAGMDTIDRMAEAIGVRQAKHASAARDLKIMWQEWPAETKEMYREMARAAYDAMSAETVKELPEEKFPDEKNLAASNPKDANYTQRTGEPT